MADLLGSVTADYRGGGSWEFTYGRYGYPNYITKRFTSTDYGSSAKAKAAALAYQKEIQPKIVSIPKTSQYDSIYKNNKSFRNYIGLSYKDFLKKTGEGKHQSFLKWQTEKNKVSKPGYTTTSTELAKKLGISENVLTTYSGKSGSKYANAPRAFVKEYFPFITTSRGGGSTIGGTINLYKDPTESVLKKWKALQKATMINKETVKGVSEIDKIFRNDIVTKKLLPDITEVISKTSLNTPSKAAYGMALYSRALRGESFRRDLPVKVNENAGKRLITQLGEDTFRNSYRTQFYNLALDNVNKLYKQNGTLKSFRTAFSKELRKALQLKGTEKIPYNINEVISLSAGETRGVQPFSVFVDATSAKVNSGALAGYQGQLSKRLQEVQDFLAEGKTSKAKEAAGKLIETQKATTANLLEQGFTKSQIKQLNLPEIKVGKKIDPKIYSPEKLARWKKAGLDIGQFVKEKGFYIDVKKAKPFWESNVRNTIVEAAKNNVGNVCNIFQGKIAYSADGGRIGFQWGCGREMTVAMQTDSKGTLQQITKTEGIIPKFKNVAQGFLGALGRFGPTAGKYGAIAAAGAIAQPLVKQFRNDDPSTYLTDPDQQAGMLDALIEGERPKPRSEILDWGIGAGTVGATAASVPGTSALYKYRRGLSEAKIPKAGPVSEAGLTAGDYLSKHAGKGYGKLRAGAGVGMKLLSGMFTPAGLLATEPLRIAQQRREGESWGDIATSPMTWMGPAFAPSMTKMATAGMKRGSLLPRLLRLGISRGALAAMGPVGWAGLAASLGWEGYSQYKDYKKGRGFFASDED